eukprot:CAMPEP_0172314720 /NCGR_PEP_ID=MMETSP1058-20130122/23241_1 /TAXON_ID=83371 /ORGANISM="Detonula confervacea, Strain CCMP 353" /LENGTH=175 /DNA_ID=CAMNT_0013028659 /DNA_START=45 /DNA_END=572 /DNA_ORIENTATION=+
MAPLQTILCTLALAATTTAFTSTPIQHPRTQQLSPLWSDKQGGGSQGGGGSAIATPKTKQITTTVQKQKQKQQQKKKFQPSDPDLKSEDDFEDAPMFRLYLIGDEGYDQQHVVTRMHEIVEDCSEDDAATLFKSAYQTGEAFMGKYPREVAEVYAEQLTRSDPIVYADVRDDQDK